MQFDHAAEEIFEEKRTTLAGVILKVNNLIERHASKIYTWKMYEVFGRYLHACPDYGVIVLKDKLVYRTTHMNLVRRERWCHGVYNVTVNEDFLCSNASADSMNIWVSFVPMPYRVILDLLGQTVFDILRCIWRLSI